MKTGRIMAPTHQIFPPPGTQVEIVEPPGVWAQVRHVRLSLTPLWLRVTIMIVSILVGLFVAFRLAYNWWPQSVRDVFNQPYIVVTETVSP